MTDRFTDLILELGTVLGLSLFVDRHHACALQVRGKTSIQLQLDSTETCLLMGSIAIEIPPGKFRENVLKEALKYNGLFDSKPAILGYLSQNNHLTFHQSFPVEILNGQRLAGYVSSFLIEVELWIDAISQGKTAPLSITLKI